VQRNNEFSPIKNANKIEIEDGKEDQDQEIKLTTTNIQNENHQHENHQKDQKNEMKIENEEEEERKIWSMEEVNELFLKHSKSSNQPPPNDLIGRDTPLSARWFTSHTYIYYHMNPKANFQFFIQFLIIFLG